MKIKVENFEGPLDLLLQLIEKEELDVTRVALLEVTEQYIEYLGQVENKHPEMLADFLLIASKLLYLKSKMLLPELQYEEEEDSLELEKQLKIYKRYYDASKVVENILAKKYYAFSRVMNVSNKEIRFEPGRSLNSKRLENIFREVIKNLEPIINLPKKTLERVISIKEKIDRIKKFLLDKGNFEFKDIVEDQTNKRDVIASFLGALELSKQRELRLEQEVLFGNILIKKVNN